MPSRTARLSKKGCGFATPECRAQRDVAVHPRPAAPAPLPAAPHRPTTALGYLEIRWVVSGTIQGNRIWRGEKDTLLSTRLSGAGFCLRNSANTSRIE